MQTMGPEAAVLSARLVELRATWVEGDAELPRDGAMWAEAAVLAAERREADERLPLERAGAWARLRRALARGGERFAPRGAPTEASLACIPLRAGARR